MLFNILLVSCNYMFFSSLFSILSLIKSSNISKYKSFISVLQKYILKIYEEMNELYLYESFFIKIFVKLFRSSLYRLYKVYYLLDVLSYDLQSLILFCCFTTTCWRINTKHILHYFCSQSNPSSI